MTQTQNKNTVQTAQAKIQSIQQAIVDGDKKLSAQDLSNARSELEFAELQQQAAEITKQKNAESTRRTTLLELQKELAAVGDSRKSVDAKFTAFEKALADYLSSCSNYQNELNGIRASLSNGGFYNGSTPIEFFGIEVSDIRRVLSVGATSAESVLPGQEIKTIIETSLGVYDRNF